MSPKDGVLTGLECTPGTSWQSASVVATVNGEPLVGLYLSYPPWRDFTVGTKGPDVQALQTELIRLGYQLTADGTYGSETSRAIRALLKDLGIGGANDELRLTDLVRLPAIDTPISACISALGSYVTNGTELASGEQTITAVELVNVPTDLLPGERTLAVGDAQVAAGDLSTVTDPDAIAALSGLPEFVAHQKDSEVPLLGRLKLSEPLHAIRVPAGAVIGAGTEEVCVRSGTLIVPVEVVGSSLGRTLITMVDSASDPPTRVDVPSATASLRCS